MNKAWPTVKLGEVLRHRKEFFEIDDTAEYKRCRVQLHVKGIVLRDVVFGADIKTKQQQECRAGEFLVAEIDAKVGGFGIVPTELDGAIVSSHYFLFAIDEQKLDRRFLEFFVRTPAFREQVTAQGSTNYAAIRPSHVLGYALPLPPLAEQRRIVAKIELLAGKIEEARKTKDAALRATDAFSPSALGAFFRKASRQVPVVELQSVTSQLTDGPHVTPQYVEDGVPFVTVQNMVTGRLDFGNLKYISADDHAEFSRRCRPERGDVLYSKDGATRGHPCFVDTDREFSFFVSVALIKPIHGELDGRYLCYVLRSSWIRDRMLEKSRGDMIPHIVLREIRRFPIPLPDIAEQRRIVAYLDNLQAKVDQLKALQAQTAAELDALLPSILDKAFRGEL